jgi:thymidylate synthase
MTDQTQLDYHRSPFEDVFTQLILGGKLVSPRGQLVLELENFSYRLPPYVRFSNFKVRNLNIDYIRKEFLWYLRGDKFDQSILECASLWKGLVNSDGSINSNYGQYIFGNLNQYDVVVKTLQDDKDSRRASIMILSESHLKMKTIDVPCTYSMNFRIRDNKLNMSVHMRSQDAIFGLGNDAPAFSFVHEMLLNSLVPAYPDLVMGDYYHTADSFHVYERHFKMLEELTGFTHNTIPDVYPATSPYELVDCPRISGPDEVDFLRAGKFVDIPEEFKFTHWLVDYQK